jgi:ribosomal protein S12 methylthiotransferase accessory factor
MTEPACSRVVALGRGAIAVSRDGVVIHSPIGTLALDGREIATLVDLMADALCAAHSRVPIVSALAPSLRPSAEKFLDLLTRVSLFVESCEDMEQGGLTEWQAVYARFVGDRPADAAHRLARGRILFVGLEPWAATAAQHIALAGVPFLHFECAEKTRRGELANALRKIAPACNVTCGVSDSEFAPPSATWSLVLDGMPSTAFQRHKELARFAHMNRCPLMFAAIEGAEVILGPLTIPQETACWECYRRRRLTNWDSAWVVPTLHQLNSSLDSSCSMGKDGTSYVCPPSAQDTLGQLVSEEVLKQILFSNGCAVRGRVLIQNFVSRETSSHLILPAPHCDVCGGAKAATNFQPVSRNPFDASSVEDLLQKTEGIVDSKIGIIAGVAIRTRRDDEPLLPICAHASVSGYSDGYVHEGRNDEAGGKGLTAVEAMIGAIGEALERYSATIVDEEAIVRARRAELDGDVLDPESMHLYADFQYDQPSFPYRRYSPDRRYPWIRGSWLDNEAESVWVPALLAYFLSGSGDTTFCQVTSNGLATGVGYHDAALRATLELIERNAYMESWTQRKPGIRILRDDQIMLESRQIIESIERLGASLELYLLPSRVTVPVVLCLGLGDGQRWPGISVTTAAGWNAQSAIHRAVIEHAYSCVHVRRTMLSSPEAIPKSAEDVRTFRDHALFYASIDRRASCAFWRTNSKSAVSITQIESWDNLSVQDKAHKLMGHGMRIAVVDVTSPDLRLTNIRVVRALSESAYQLVCGAGLQRRVSNHQGFITNSDPHPMA